MHTVEQSWPQNVPFLLKPHKIFHCFEYMVNGMIKGLFDRWAKISPYHLTSGLLAQASNIQMHFLFLVLKSWCIVSTGGRCRINRFLHQYSPCYSWLCIELDPTMLGRLNGSLSFSMLFLGIFEFTPNLPTSETVWNPWHIVCCPKNTGDSNEQWLTFSHSLHSLHIKVINKLKIK